MIGELFASQLYAYIKNNIIETNGDKKFCFVDNSKIGNYLTEKVFIPGRTLNWMELIKSATGEELSANYFKSEFIDVKY